MTTVFIPRMIRTAEEAEALPVGTLATHHRYMPVQKWKSRSAGPIWGYYEDSIEPEELIGWTALVPVEAYVETLAEYAVRTDSREDQLVRRYVTEWEDV